MWTINLFIFIFLFLLFSHSHSIMSLDKFGRFSHVLKSESSRGPKGEGFNLNSDGNFDIQRKKLCNVSDPTDNDDVVTLKYMKKHTVTKNKLNKFDANNVAITNVANPIEDSDVVTLKFFKTRSLLLNKEIDAKHKIIKNLARPKEPHDAINYVYFMEVLATLSYAIYLKLNENKKKKFTKLEWVNKVLANLQDWDILFEATDN